MEFMRNEGEIKEDSLKEKAQTPKQQVGIVTEKHVELKNSPFQSLDHLCLSLHQVKRLVLRLSHFGAETFDKTQFNWKKNLLSKICLSG